MSDIRSVDRARAAQMIVAMMTDDVEMFAAAVHDTFDDDFGLGGMGSTINVLRSMADDLASAIKDRHGDEAVALVRAVIVGERS